MASTPRETRPPAQRVRVVLGEVVPRPRTPGGPTVAELTAQTGVGDALVKGLVRAQLALALRLAAVVAVGLGTLPVVFAVAPKLAAVRPFGVALPWLLLGVAAFPFLFGVGWVYVHLAERNERDFVDVVGRH
jgi:hypothetical protein